MTKNPWDVLKQGANVTVDVPIGSKCHCGRFDLGRFVKAPTEIFARMSHTINSEKIFALTGKGDGANIITT